MTSGTDETSSDSREPTDLAPTDLEPDPTDPHHPESAFPYAGDRMSDAERQAALDAEPAGNATVGDMVDTDVLDSRAHESGPGAQEVAEQVLGRATD